MVTGLIQQALRYVVPQLERTEYPAYKFYEQFIPIDDRPMPGVETVTYQRITHYGVWTPLGSNANALEPSDFRLETVSYGAEYFQAKFTYTQVEIDRIEFANQNQAYGLVLNLTQEKYNAVLEGYKQLVDDVFAIGRPASNIFGILTHPDVSRLVSPSPITFDNDPDTNLAILARGALSIVQATREVEYPDRLILPTSVFNVVLQQRLGSSSDTTVLEHFLRVNPWIRGVDTSPRLENAGLNGGRVAIYYRYDPNKLVGIIPKPLTVLPPQQVAHGFEVYCHAQISGVHVRRPGSVLIMEGV